ncbi:hypothetical protein HLB44_03040 [Aquincola sp. S2]|uniref:Uncharacterized protein n=1 Tax=Pseudaquabacterium terrae TaxID=2732868 RepID=A0ABX2EDA9_9BURK|nr:hypothetical protein [Aquabacterium terrae]NRF65957.1 hypothetical protein [Aquabacterium terrae]
MPIAVFCALLGARYNIAIDKTDKFAHQNKGTLVRVIEMQVPPLTDACWLRLAASRHVRLSITHLPTLMMLDRVRSSNDEVAVKAAELFAYFVRWSDSLAPELAQIREL